MPRTDIEEHLEKAFPHLATWARRLDLALHGKPVPPDDAKLSDRETVPHDEKPREGFESTELARRTGLRGRPTSKHLVLAECERRMRDGWKPESRADAARVLSAWLAEAHAAAPPLSPGTIENILREKPKRKPKRSPR